MSLFSTNNNNDDGISNTKSDVLTLDSEITKVDDYPIELKVQEYEENNLEFTNNTKLLLGDKKYNQLSFIEKYVLFRYFIEDIDIDIKESYLSQKDNKKEDFINLILKYYNNNIKYDGNSLNELDYYYVTPFTFFLNYIIKESNKKNHYINSMQDMITNRINKKNKIWDDKSLFNDLERIKQKVQLYKTTNPDIYDNFKKSFSKEDFEVMPLSQKCILLRILIDGVLKYTYKNINSIEGRKKFIIAINELYKKIIKLNNFSYDWYISSFYIFEDYIKMHIFIQDIEKNKLDLINIVINAIGIEKYSKMDIVQKYIFLKFLFEKTAIAILNVVDTDESKKYVLNNFYDDCIEYFRKDYSLNDINDTYKQLVERYNENVADIQNHIKHLYGQNTTDSKEYNDQLYSQQTTTPQQNQSMQSMLQQQLQQQTTTPQQNQSMQSMLQQQLQQQTTTPQQNQSMQSMLQQQLQQQIKASQQNLTTTQVETQTQNNTDPEEIIYFAGYKDNDKTNLSLYKMKRGKFEIKKDQFIKEYNILSYKNNNGSIIPITITENFYINNCDSDKNKCLLIIKEKLNDLQASNISNKIRAFRNISTAK